MGKKIGYIRVSTIVQNEDRQLASVSLDKEFVEKASARSQERVVLRQMIDFVREGDDVWVHDISRLARNISDLHNLVREITGKGVRLHFFKEGLTFTSDESDAMSELLLSLLGAVYQFERTIMLERQREGIEIAKRAGKYKGRKKSVDEAKIVELLKSGLSMRKTAAELKVSLSSVQRAKSASAA